MKAYNYEVEHLYEIENTSKQTECLCQRVTGENRNTRIHDHNFYEIFLTLNDVVHFINGKTEQLQRGTLVFIKPIDIHGIMYCDNRKSEIINLTFSSKILHLLLNYLDVSITYIDNLNDTVIILDEIKTLKLTEKLNKIIADNNSDLIYTRCVVFELVTMFFNKSLSEEKSFPIWFEDMCNQMKLKENFCAGAEQMIRLSGKSREYISRSMRKYLGITPSDFVNDLRLSHTAAQLIKTDKSITELCFEAGFYSTSWFNKIFLQKYGMSPKEFRKKGKEL